MMGRHRHRYRHNSRLIARHPRVSKTLTRTKLVRDCAGGSIVEFTLVFPIFILVALGTVDVGLMLSEWAQANTATYVGAHRAIVSDPVAPNLNAFFNNTIVGGMGLPCADPVTGDATGNCPTFAPIVCTSTACTPNTYGDLNLNNFDDIYKPMRQVFGCSQVPTEACRLERANVTITYQREANLNNLGFNEANGFPMTVTVSITGLTHQFYFLDGLVRFFWRRY